MHRWLPALEFRRQLGPFEDCHSEWSVISDQLDAGQASTPELLRIAVDAIRAAIDIPPDFLSSRTTDIVVTTWPGEHYRLLPAICDTFAAKRIVEIGTWRGESAAAMLHGRTVENIDTFDIFQWQDVPGSVLRTSDFGDRLTQHVADAADRESWAKYSPMFSAADLVFVDGPKDGSWEQRFFELFLGSPPEQPQLVLIDDTRLMTMVRLWRELPPPKLDLTSFGHFSGTGLLLRQPA